ncbi:hypothetical protein NQ317_001932 [Molorchus minor]|uniref:BED-type domain-containing protein n=1 Tax=Molorchus minor TaxID=1323400 RepID=A0ABQ9JDM1_9CUCU|nr:hypothetical protein NQ317_001932 [Molorchus minor]
MFQHEADFSPRGRKAHNFYENLKYTHKRLENGRRAAQCTICKALLKNTSIARLRTHRKRCHSDKVSRESISETYSDDSNCSKQEFEPKIKDARSEQHADSMNILVAGDDNSFYGNLKYNYRRLGNGRKAAQCIICKALFKNTAIARLRTHRKRCHSDISKESISETFSDDFKMKDFVHKIKETKSKPRGPHLKSTNILIDDNETLEVIFLSDEEEDVDTDNKLCQNITTIPKKLKRNKLNKLSCDVDPMTPNLKEEIDISLAKFFLGCNIPFSVVESDNFKNFMKTLQPSYSPPSLQTLSAVLLDKILSE